MHNQSNSNDVQIGAKGIDTAAIANECRQAVSAKKADGTYRTANLDENKVTNPIEFRNDAEFLTFYLESLRESAFVDISDFEIEEKRPRFRKAVIGLKKTIWNLLKFYTYRLWSQQNQINGLLLSAIEGIHERQQAEIKRLNARIEQLEKQRNSPRENDD